MRGKLFILFLISVFLISQASAFFPQSHISWTLNGFNDVSSSITEKCRPYINLVLDGNNGADAGVTHYGESGESLGAYLYPHTRAGYEICLQQSGTNVQKQCICVGQALHLIQDDDSHNYGGVTQKYLKSEWGSNYVGHIILERDFESKHMALLRQEGSYSITSGQMDFYNKKYLDSFFIQDSTGKLVSSEYLKLMNDVAGINIEQDMRIVRSGYQGEGFYSTVYKDKVSLPWWVYGISIGMIIIGLSMTIFVLWAGKTRWKWFTAFTWLLLFIVGVIVLASFLTGTTWKLTTFLVEIPPKFGYLSISDKDIAYYDNLVQQETNQFLKDGVLNIDDATGLSYVDRNGVYHVGALTESEKGFKYLMYFGVIPAYLLLQLFLIYKSIKIKKRKK